MDPKKYRTIFIVDPVRGDRIQLAKFLKHDQFTVMAFISITDCFRKNQVLHPDLMVYALRKGKTELKHLFNIKMKKRALPFILVLTPEAEDIHQVNLQEKGFTQVFKASNNEKIREIAYEILAPDGLETRAETPHPVPIP